VIGTTYGAGDGSTTFNLPDSRGRASVNKSTDTEFDTMGEKSGSKTEALTIAQIPSHTHIQDAHAHGVYDPGHNHSQNPHSHSQNVSNPVAGGQGIRNDYNSDGAGGIYPQGIYTDNAWPTNNAATTGIGIYNTTATNQYTGGGGAHNNIQPSIVKLAAIKYAPIDTASVSLPAATSINGYWSTPPTGFLLEDGSAVSRTTYSALFAVIGTTYGAGDGSTTFNLPDSRGRASVNKSTDTEFDTMGEKSGSKTEALTIAQIPSHTHIQDAHAHGVYDPGHNHSQNPHMHGQVVTANAGPSVRSDWNSDSASGAYAQGINTSDATGTNNPATTGIGIYNATATNQYTGGGAAHNNIQPSIVKLSAIKYTPESTVGTPIAPATSVSGYWSAAPTGYLAEDGSAVSRATYANLFNAIGTTYGVGDGLTTFNLPDSRGRVSVNKSSDVEFNAMGKKYGEKSHVLTIAELASHTHIQDAHAHGVYDPGHNHSQNGHSHPQMVTNPLAGWPGIRNDYDSDAMGNIYSQGITTGVTTATNNPSTTGIGIYNATATNQYTGGGGAHNEIQPSIVKMFAIKY
jgi:microcystin-dependent protein